MFKLIKKSLDFRNVRQIKRLIVNRRTFLSQAYYCDEPWEQRFEDPILQKVNVDEFYIEIDQKYQRTKNMSAVDVDVFAHAVKEQSYTDELLDLIHKLRMSADTCNTLNSTSHAVVRDLLSFGKTDLLLSALDDRLNYGLFLDYYTANILLDTFWKNKDFLSGARVASQLMLQEDFNHPLCANLSLLHCYNYLLKPTEWPQPPKPEEPEEEVKIRINYLRNPYDDDHFDLRDANKIVGKTLIMITKGVDNSLDKSFHLLGLALFEKHEKAKEFIQNLSGNNNKVYEEVLKLIPDENPTKLEVKNLQTESANIEKLLEDRVKSTVANMAEKDIALQCENYFKWTEERKEALKRQHERLLTAKRLANIEETQKHLKEKEMLLWFFENEENIELTIEDKKTTQAQSVKKTKKIKEDENYVPPEIVKSFNK